MGINQFKKMSNTDPVKLEEVIQKAMKEFDLTRNETLSYLVEYVCMHGDLENFRNIVNFVISTQEKEDGF